MTKTQQAGYRHCQERLEYAAATLLHLLCISEWQMPVTYPCHAGYEQHHIYKCQYNIPDGSGTPYIYHENGDSNEEGQKELYQYSLERAYHYVAGCFYRRSIIDPC